MSTLGNGGLASASSPIDSSARRCVPRRFFEDSLWCLGVLNKLFLGVLFLTLPGLCFGVKTLRELSPPDFVLSPGLLFGETLSKVKTLPVLFLGVALLPLPELRLLEPSKTLGVLPGEILLSLIGREKLLPLSLGLLFGDMLAVLPVLFLGFGLCCRAKTLPELRPGDALCFAEDTLPELRPGDGLCFKVETWPGLLCGETPETLPALRFGECSRVFLD